MRRMLAYAGACGLILSGAVCDLVVWSDGICRYGSLLGVLFF